MDVSPSLAGLEVYISTILRDLCKCKNRSAFSPSSLLKEKVCVCVCVFSLFPLEDSLQTDSDCATLQGTKISVNVKCNECGGSCGEKEFLSVPCDVTYATGDIYKTGDRPATGSLHSSIIMRSEHFFPLRISVAQCSQLKC